MHPDSPPDSKAEGDAFLSSTNNLTLAGMLALSGVAAESMVQDVGWTMMDIGKRIERGLAIDGAAACHARQRPVAQALSKPSRNPHWWPASHRSSTGDAIPGMVSVAAVADLVLFDAENPRSLAYQLERLRTGPEGAARDRRVRRGPSGWSTRSPPGCAASSPPTSKRSRPDGTRAELADLLNGMHARPARPVRRHHRDPPVAARRHAAAVGPRRTPGDAVTAFPDGPTASGSSRCYQVHAPHGVPLLRCRHQLLRPWLSHAARLRAATLPVARVGDRTGGRRQLHQPRRLRQHQLVLPCHRAAPEAVDHQQVGGRGGSAAGRPLRRRIGAGAVGDRAAGRAGRRAGHRVHP